MLPVGFGLARLEKRPVSFLVKIQTRPFQNGCDGFQWLLDQFLIRHEPASFVHAKPLLDSSIVKAIVAQLLQYEAARSESFEMVLRFAKSPDIGSQRVFLVTADHREPGIGEKFRDDRNISELARGFLHKISPPAQFQKVREEFLASSAEFV